MKRFTSPFTETVRLIFRKKREAVEFANSQLHLQHSIRNVSLCG